MQNSKFQEDELKQLVADNDMDSFKNLVSEMRPEILDKSLRANMNELFIRIMESHERNMNNSPLIIILDHWVGVPDHEILEAAMASGMTNSAVLLVEFTPPGRLVGKDNRIHFDALHVAARHGQYKSISAMLRRNEPSLTKSIDSALIMAVAAGNNECVSELLGCKKQNAVSLGLLAVIAGEAGHDDTLKMIISEFQTPKDAFKIVRDLNKSHETAKTIAKIEAIIFSGEKILHKRTTL